MTITNGRSTAAQSGPGGSGANLGAPGGHSGAGTGAEVTEILAALRREALEVGGPAARPVSRVRLSVGDVCLEIDWAGSADPGGHVGANGTTQGGPGHAHPTPRPGSGLSTGLATTAAASQAPAGVAGPAGTAGHGGAAGQSGGRGPEGDDTLAFVVPAHTVGVFYHAPEPGADPFVRPGDAVVAGQQVGIIEAMKLMIPVEAERGGQVREILVADATPVEYGQPLLTLDVATPGGTP